MYKIFSFDNHPLKHFYGINSRFSVFDRNQIVSMKSVEIKQTIINICRTCLKLPVRLNKMTYLFVFFLVSFVH